MLRLDWLASPEAHGDGFPRLARQPWARGAGSEVTSVPLRMGFGFPSPTHLRIAGRLCRLSFIFSLIHLEFSQALFRRPASDRSSSSRGFGGSLACGLAPSSPFLGPFKSWIRSLSWALGLAGSRPLSGSRVLTSPALWVSVLVVLDLLFGA